MWGGWGPEYTAGVCVDKGEDEAICGYFYPLTTAVTTV